VVLTDAGRERSRAARVTHLAGVRARFLQPLGAHGVDAVGAAWTRLAATPTG
jgi:hypothetical protein